MGFLLMRSNVEVLKNPAVYQRADSDAVLWSLSTMADEQDQHLQRSGIGAWALAEWMLQDLRFSRFSHLEVDFFGRCLRAVREFVHLSPVGRLVCWRFRMDTAFKPLMVNEASAIDPPSQDFEMILDPVRDQHSLLFPMLRFPLRAPECHGVPACDGSGRPIVWLLHLFSGRRRIGDCHWWLTHIGHHLWPDVQLRMISLDTAVHATLGNLAAGPNFERVLGLARSGAIAGCLTGPPCETWSAARHLTFDESSGPRPLRSAALPWCLPSCTGKELRQVSTGSHLMLNSLRIEADVVLSGGGSVMEHPTENDQADRASIWRTELHQKWLMQLPGSHRHLIQQYLYGAAGVKPTCLRALNLGPPEYMTAILQEGMEMWRSRPTAKLAGRDEKGAFRTAAAKEYSSALCRTLVVALVKCLRQRASTEGLAMASNFSPADQQWLCDAWSASHIYSLESFLPDYQGV